MRIIDRVSVALQEVFGKCTQAAAESSGVIQRQRKFDAVSLAKTFVLGFLQKPAASDESLAQMAAQIGVDVTPQAIDQRHTPALVSFLEALFRQTVQLIVGSRKTLAPILERFTSVVLLDSTMITLPPQCRQRFPGCGGSHGSGQAALKLQVELDLRSGALQHVELEAGRQPDGASCRQYVRRGRGALRIADLGYFSTAVFAAMTAVGEYYLSRLQFGLGIKSPDGEKLSVIAWLGQQHPGWIDRAIVINFQQPLACRLIAWRLPAEQASRCRRKLHERLNRKQGKQPSAERLAWCDWTILLTNVPDNLLTPAEAAVLYRGRWQIELLFKRWKSQDLVALLSGSTVVRQMVRLWSRLIAAVIQQWLIVAGAWGDRHKSLNKLCEAIRQFVGRIAAGLQRRAELRRALRDLARVLSTTCRRNKRKKPGTFELLNDPTLLSCRLT